MIITTSTHRSGKRGHAKLVTHLAKTENEEAILAEIGNCIAATLAELIETMEIYAPAGRAAVHHVTINPAKNISRERLLQAAHKVRCELDSDGGNRPYGIVIHRKKRSGKGGAGADEHAHLVLGAVDATGTSLDDGWSKIRTERVARELEFELGEPALCGRHHRPVLKALCVKRPEVYLWLLDALGPDPEKPQSAFSPAARNRARGQNLNLPKAKASVRAIWQKSESFNSFRSGLGQIGFRILPGGKAGVFLIVDEKGRMIGAANRILKIRREQFNKMMEFSNEPGVRSAALTDVGRTKPASVRTDLLSSSEDRGTGGPVGAVEFGIGSGAARRPDSSDHSLTQSTGRERASPRAITLGDKTRTRSRQRALTRLRKLDFAVLRALAATARSISAFPFDEPNVSPQDDDLLVHKDIWGIVRLPKPRW